MIFNLCYYSHFSYTDCENMTPNELRFFSKKLLETKDAENKARENAIKSAESKRSKISQLRPARRKSPSRRRRR